MKFTLTLPQAKESKAVHHDRKLPWQRLGSHDFINHRNKTQSEGLGEVAQLVEPQSLFFGKGSFSFHSFCTQEPNTFPGHRVYCSAPRSSAKCSAFCSSLTAILAQSEGLTYAWALLQSASLFLKQLFAPLVRHNYVSWYLHSLSRRTVRNA